MAYKKKTAQELQQEIENLTSDINEKVSSYYDTPEKIREHLKFMAQFYNYSPKNQALIQKQFSGAIAVGSFAFWKKKGASVKKGEKGIKILTPVKVEQFQRTLKDGTKKWINIKYATPTEDVGIKTKKIPTEKFISFKIGHVFEYTQTNAREIGLEVSEIFGRFHVNTAIEKPQEFLKACEKLAKDIDVKILKEPIEEIGAAKGVYYQFPINAIALNPRNTPADSVLTMVHELAHAQMHNNNKSGAFLTTAEKEFQAEMVSYVVASHFNIEVEEHSLSYIANWAKTLTTEEKNLLTSDVRDTAKYFISKIEEELNKQLELTKEFNNTHFIKFNENSVDTQQVSSTQEIINYLSEQVPNFDSGEFKNQNFDNENDISSYINHKYEKELFLYQHKSDTPKALIEETELDLPVNAQLNFHTLNQISSKLEEDHFDNDTISKTKYHVIFPQSDGTIDVVSPPTLETGDGYYANTYQQLVSEELLTKEQDNALLTDIAIYNHESKFGSFDKETIPEPMMVLHGYNPEFHRFGVANHMPFDEMGLDEIKYTVAIPENDSVYTYSNSYKEGKFVFPLHQMQKDSNVSKNRYSLLEEDFHNVLAVEEQQYISSWLEQLPQHIKNEKDKQNRQSKSHEINR